MEHDVEEIHYPGDLLVGVHRTRAARAPACSGLSPFVPVDRSDESDDELDGSHPIEFAAPRRLLFSFAALSVLLLLLAQFTAIKLQ